MNLIKFLKENRKGFLYSLLTLVLGYPIIYMIQNNETIPLTNFLLAIPICASMLFILMMIFGLLFWEEKNAKD